MYNNVLYLRKKVKIYFLLPFILFSTNYAHAECTDLQAVNATTKAALDLLSNSEVFEQGKVLKVHLPSRRKETAVYLKSNNKYYTFFGLVTTDCTAHLMKRTQGKY